MHTPDFLLEVCAGSLFSAREAEAGGAARVELCENLAEGGTTPSYGTLTAAREALRLAINVMIRPRGGDFLYSDEELDVMRRDIALCKRLGMDGVVLGVMTPDGEVDVARTRELVECAHPLPVTFHRAFDLTRDPFLALEQVIETGCRRLLTSGQAASALMGAERIHDLRQQAGDRLIIMPGCGVRADNIGPLRALTGCVEFHASARLPVPTAMRFRPEDVQLGAPGSDEYARQETSAAQVAAIVEAAGAAG